MAFVISNLIPALQSYNVVKKTNGFLEKSIRNLSSGLRVNSAADDAAGLAIVEKMQAQSRGLAQANRNSQDGISLLQTAEGGLREIHSLLQRMRELSVQAANDALTSQDRMYVQSEIDELLQQIDAIANQTQFNRKKLLNGNAAVLWSSSSFDVGVVVSGALLTKDIFGATRSAAGNYKITFNSIHVGREEIQKSNIMYLKHGTLDNNTQIFAESGLTGLSALNLVEGVWNIESRDSPFGSVQYYHGATSSNETVVGASLSASNSSDMMAPGVYEIRLSEKVPMMADFTAAQAAGVVTGVNMATRTGGGGYEL